MNGEVNLKCIFCFYFSAGNQNEFSSIARGYITAIFSQVRLVASRKQRGASRVKRFKGNTTDQRTTMDNIETNFGFFTLRLFLCACSSIVAGLKNHVGGLYSKEMVACM